MIEFLLIVLPCTVVGTVIVLVLDRVGVLPNIDRYGPVSSRPVNSSMGRPLSLAAIVILGAWILAWLVLLVVGLSILNSSV